MPAPGSVQCLSSASIKSVGISSSIIGISLIALTVLIDILAIGYIIGKIFPHTGIRGWIQGEYWEIAKTAMLIGGIFSVLGFLSSIAIVVSGTGSPSGSYLTNIGGLTNSAEQFLTKVSCQIDTNTDYLFGLSESTGGLSSVNIALGIPIVIPVVDITFEFGFEKAALFATPLVQQDSSVSNFESITNDLFILMVLPTTVLVVMQQSLLPTLVVIGLGVLIPIGLIFRALPVIRGVGGTLVAIGIGLAIIYPAMLVTLNQSVDNAFPLAAPSTPGLYLLRLFGLLPDRFRDKFLLHKVPGGGRGFLQHKRGIPAAQRPAQLRNVLLPPVRPFHNRHRNSVSAGRQHCKGARRDDQAPARRKDQTGVKMLNILLATACGTLTGGTSISYGALNPNDWIGINTAVVLISVLIAALIYAISRFLPVSRGQRLRGIAKYEIAEAFISLIIIAVLIGLSSFACNAGALLAGQGSGFPGISRFDNIFLGNMVFEQGTGIISQLYTTSIEYAIASNVGIASVNWLAENFLKSSLSVSALKVGVELDSGNLADTFQAYFERVYRGFRASRAFLPVRDARPLPSPAHSADSLAHDSGAHRDTHALPLVHGPEAQGNFQHFPCDRDRAVLHIPPHDILQLLRCQLLQHHKHGPKTHRLPRPCPE